MQERRRDPRLTTPYTALYCSYNGVRAVKIKDLSRSGAAIVFQNDIMVNIGDKVVIHFYSRETKTLVSKMLCTVVRAFNSDGDFAIGVEFCDQSSGVDTILDFLSTSDVE
ncbi:MAG: PilZ domain-containing protein [Lachnospiraceae bacterium]|nr:PilZ domain-containing protein [Lachnospiraceae bacterium]